MKNPKQFFLPKGSKVVVLDGFDYPSVRMHRIPERRFVEGNRVYCKPARKFGVVARVWSSVPYSYGIRFDDGHAMTASDEMLIRDVLGEMAGL